VDIGRKTVVDPDLGESTRFGVKRGAISLWASLGVLTLVCPIAASNGRWPLLSWAAIFALDLVFWIVAWWLLQTSLLVGEHGFRQSSPSGMVGASWQRVSGLGLQMRGRGGGSPFVVVSFRDGESESTTDQTLGGVYGFAADATEIRDLMAERLAAFEATASERE
jgi:hypothetical protein